MGVDNVFKIYAKIPIEDVLEFLFAKFLMSHHDDEERNLFAVTISNTVPDGWNKIYQSNNHNSTLIAQNVDISHLDDSLSKMLKYEVLDIADIVYAVTKFKNTKFVKVKIISMYSYGYSSEEFTDENKLKDAFKKIKEYRDKFPNIVILQKFTAS